MNRKRTERVLLHYGKCVIESDVFQKSFMQVHHKYSTVGEHSLGVAYYALRISYFLHYLHIRPDLENVVIASLCHDLGILRCKEKYRHELECCMKHPRDSVTVFRSMQFHFPYHEKEKKKRIENAIRHHMFPQTLLPPRYLEGFILTLADKICFYLESKNKAPGRILLEERGDEIRKTIQKISHTNTQPIAL